MSKQHDTGNSKARPSKSDQGGKTPGKGRRSIGNLLLVAALAVMGMTAFGVMSLSGKPAEAADITVYKSPTCGCCGNWIEHIKANGYSVEVRERTDLQPIKQEMGVAPELQSCHTAVVDGYVIEGHVPAADIRRLLAERPDIKGLAVPGMPMGSPGMEGPRKDHYSVLTIDSQGGTSVYSRY